MIDVWAIVVISGQGSEGVTMAEFVVCEGTPAMSLEVPFPRIYTALPSLFGVTESGELGLVQ